MAPAKRTPRHLAREARNDVYRAHILEAAERVFADEGFSAARLQDISKRAGLSMGTIYAIFPSKDDILGAILDERGRELVALAEEIAARPVPPLDALHALSEAYIGYFLDHPNFLQMHLREGSSWVVSPSPNADSRVQLWKTVHDIQTNIFRRGIKAGVFVDEDPAYLAKMFSAMDQVLLADWVTTGMKADRAALVKRLQSMVQRAFCRR